MWYFLALLVFYLAFTGCPKCLDRVVLERMMQRLSHGQATTGGEAQREGRGMSCWETFRTMPCAPSASASGCCRAISRCASISC
jgi:hypothetical protein